jgi:mannitol/fructose-specific phosphotransferase system IIA component (Ntr-type)
VSTASGGTDVTVAARETGAAARRALDEARLALHIVLDGHAGALTDNQQELLETVRDALETAATAVRVDRGHNVTDIRGLVQPGAIALDLDVADKEELLAAMVGLLDFRQLMAETVLKLVHRRECEGPTWIGHGFAVPHCRTAGVDRVVIAYGRCRTAIDYAAPDGQPVRHVFLLVAPSVDLTHQYLQTMAALARRARTEEFRALLDGAVSPAGVIGVLG